MAPDPDLSGKALCWDEDVSLGLSNGDGLQWDDATQQFVPGGGGGGGVLITYAAGDPIGGVDRQVQIRDDEAIPPHAAGPTNRGLWQREGAAWLRVAPRYLHGDNHATGGPDPIQPGDIGAAPTASPVLTGDPKAPTPAVDDNDTSIATTGFVAGQAASVVPIMDGSVAVIGTSLRYARQDHVHPVDTTRAPIASPTFTGTPAGPTAAVDTNTTQLATTAFVLAQASAVGDGTPTMAGTAARGTSTHYARADHVHPTDTTRAPLASPALTGTPTAPTAAVDTNTTQIATTAFVLAQASATTPNMDGTGAVGTSTRFARADHVHPVDTSRMSATVTWSGDLGGTGSSPTVKQASGSFDLLATNPAIAFKGDIDTAKWIIRMGGFAITFSSDNGDATDLGTGQTTYSSRTYKPKVSIGPDGAINAKTATVDTNTTQLATTAWVMGQLATTVPNVNGTGAAGSSTRVARADHVHPTDTSRKTDVDYHVRAFASADVAINGSTVTAVALNSERWDNPNNDQHDTVTNNSRLTCKAAGLYTISASVQWASATVERQIRLRVNGATDIATVSMPVLSAAAQMRQSVSTTYRLAVNDYVELTAFQASAVGTNISVLAQGNHSPELSMARISG